METRRHISSCWNLESGLVSIVQSKRDQEHMQCVDTSLWQYGMGVFWLDFV